MVCLFLLYLESSCMVSSHLKLKLNKKLTTHNLSNKPVSYKPTPAFLQIEKMSIIDVDNTSYSQTIYSCFEEFSVKNILSSTSLDHFKILLQSQYIWTFRSVCIHWISHCNCVILWTPIIFALFKWCYFFVILRLSVCVKLPKWFVETVVFAPFRVTLTTASDNRNFSSISSSELSESIMLTGDYRIRGRKHVIQIRYLICVYASHFFAERPYHFNRTLRTANKF